MQALVNRVPERFRSPIAWLMPVLFALWLYREGIQAWFMQDDFAWLGLLRQVSGPRDILPLLFNPAAQGTIRPWSERGFFLLFEYVFGIDNLPFRTAAFLFMAANLAMVGWIVRRITGSRLAGTVAGVVWMANTALVTVMTWSSAFNEALCPFFLLAALTLFIRYADTGRRLFWWLQLVVFVLGFGALETNIVYPALAAAWALFIEPAQSRRKLLLSLAPLFAISILYFLVHRLLAPIPPSGPYAAVLDARVFGTLAYYAKHSLLPSDFFAFGHSRRAAILIVGICTVALAVFAVRESMARRPAILFFLAWFLITLTPILPLPDHRTDYYLTIPLIGFGMLAGYAFSRFRMLSALPILVYLAGMIPVTLAATHWTFLKTEGVRVLVEGVDAAHQAHPSKTILLDGVSTELYDLAISHSPFYALGIDRVFLTPDSDSKIHPTPGGLELDQAVLEPWVTLRLLKRNEAVIYSVSGNHLRNITEDYERSAPNLLTNRLPAHVDPGNPLFADLLGTGWLAAENGFRWMSGTATLTIRRPGPRGGNLVIDGYCPEDLLKQTARHLSVKVDGVQAGETKIVHPEARFQRLFVLQAAAASEMKSMTVEIAADPVVHRDGREYGVVIDRISVVDR